MLWHSKLIFLSNKSVLHNKVTHKSIIKTLEVKNQCIKDLIRTEFKTLPLPNFNY